MMRIRAVTAALLNGLGAPSPSEPTAAFLDPPGKLGSPGGREHLPRRAQGLPPARGAGPPARPGRGAVGGDRAEASAREQEGGCESNSAPASARRAEIAPVGAGAWIFTARHGVLLWVSGSWPVAPKMEHGCFGAMSRM